MKIKKLPLFPRMQCDPDCGECCGALFVPEADYQRLRRVVKERGIDAHSKPDDPYRCPLYQNGQCTVYDERPAVCRAYGHIEALACNRGYNVNVPSEPVRAAIASRGVAVRLLHELAAEAHPGSVDLDLVKAWIYADLRSDSHARRIPDRPKEKIK